MSVDTGELLEEAESKPETVDDTDSLLLEHNDSEFVPVDD